MKFTKIFITYLFKYLLAFLLIFSFSFIIFSVSRNNIKTYILKQTNTELQDGIHTMKEALDKMTLTSQLVYQNTDFQKLILFEEDTDTPQILLKLRNSNDHFAETCSLISDIPYAFILFRNNNLFLSNIRSNCSFDNYYGEFLHIHLPDAELSDTNSLKKLLFEKHQSKHFFIPTQSITYTTEVDNTLEDAILYLTNGSFSYTYSSHIFCYVLSKDMMINYLFSPKFADDGFIYIQDAYSGTKLFSHGNIPEIVKFTEAPIATNDVPDYYITQITEKNPNWHITLGITTSYINRQVSSAQNLLLIYLFLGLVVVLILALYFSLTRYYGFKQTLSTFPTEEITQPNQKSNSDYKLLIHNITQLEASKQSYLSQLEELQNLNQSILLENLMTRGVFSENEIQGFEKCFPKKLNNYCIATVRSYYSASEANNINAEIAMRDFLTKRKIALFGNVHSSISDQLFLIELSPSQEPNTHYLVPIFEDMAIAISETYNCTLHIGISTVGTGLSNVHKCYEQTLKIIQSLYMHENENVIQTYDCTANSITENPITLEVLTHLYNFMICGQYVDTTKELMRIENFYKKTPHIYELHKEQLFYSLKNLFHTIIISLNCKAYENQLPQYLPSMTCSEMIADYKDFAACICDYISQEKKSHNEKLTEKILMIIHQKYGDCALSAYSVSKEVGISENYLGKFLKEQTGKSFSSYILHVRVEKAKEYLKKTNYTNSEIATLTGFASTNTFYRNFQKITGITPKLYKEKETDAPADE